MRTKFLKKNINEAKYTQPRRTHETEIKCCPQAF